MALYNRNYLVFFSLCLAFLFACKKEDPSAPAAAKAPEGSLVLRVDYGSEKKTWMEEVTKAFNDSQTKTASGKPIFVQLAAMGSGEAMQNILNGTSKPHVFSPASEGYLTLLNDQWISKGNNKPLVGSNNDDLLLSPVVIAMWKPMAEALGWPTKSIGWADILAIGSDPEGWSKYGHPEWGRFKLGHTHPRLSNSGLLAVLAEAYAGAKKTRDLTEADLDTPEVLDFMTKIEGTLVHYGKSTNFFADKMLSRGPGYISAAVLYENTVIESYSRSDVQGQFPLVSIYPTEGTFWSDHPYAVLDADWVGKEEAEAAQVFLKFLKAPEQQNRALALGFRPADTSIRIAAPIDAAHGADPSQPQTLLDVPDGKTLNKLLDTWEKTKKSSDVLLIFDKSGSMTGKPLAGAKQGAVAFLDFLGDRDEVSLLFFDSEVYTPTAPQALAQGARDALKQNINSAIASGGTALYDAIQKGYTGMKERASKNPERIHAIVVMTDGKDEDSQNTLQSVLDQFSRSTETSTVRIFTIAYGSNADPTILSQIAEAAGGAMSKGDTSSITGIFADMAAFF